MIDLRDGKSELRQTNGREGLTPKQLIIYDLEEMRGAIEPSVVFSGHLDVGLISSKAIELIEQLHRSDDLLFSISKIANVDRESRKVSEYYYSMY